MPEPQLIAVDEAWRRVREAMPRPSIHRLPITRAAGHILAQSVAADRDQPPFDRATMDGIAINTGGWQAGRRDFEVTGIQAAGAPPQELGSSQHCLEVMTGAVMPEGADCVVPVEQVTMHGSTARVAADADCSPGRFVHPRGSDYASGTGLLHPGVRLRSPELAVLAAVGMADVAVVQWPDTVVISTGDELVDPGEPTAPHQVRRANDFAIAGALHQRGFDQVTTLHLRDDPQSMRRLVQGALEQHQLLILSGGVSRGKFDYLPQVFDELGVRRIFHRVRQKPGKPMWFGLAPDGTPVFALPGNPVSALVGLTRYVLPALEWAAGARPLRETVELGCDVDLSGTLTHFVPVVLEQGPAGRTIAVPRELNTSGDFFGLAETAGIMEFDEQHRHCPAGLSAPLYRW